MASAAPLVFGIATQTNNGLGSAFVLATDGSSNFITTYMGKTLNGSFIDSGSNGLFFPDSTITVCTSTTSDPNARPVLLVRLDALALSADEHRPGRGRNPVSATSTVPFDIHQPEQHQR